MNRRRFSRQDHETEPPKAGRITAISPQQRDDARMNIDIDGSFAFGLHADVVLNHYLGVDTELTPEKIKTLLHEDEVKQAIIAALNQIAFRPRASGELIRKLREKGYAPEAAEAAVQRMLDLGYLNDADFADRWIENRQEHKPRSRKMLQQELRQKGIDPETIRDALENTEIDEFSDALGLARKKAGSMQGLDQVTRHRRLSGFLGRRGYTYDVIRKVLEEIP
jgi:regulatory protein